MIGIPVDTRGPQCHLPSNRLLAGKQPLRRVAEPGSIEVAALDACLREGSIYRFQYKRLRVAFEELAEAGHARSQHVNVLAHHSPPL